MDAQYLESLFQPKNVAVVGATNNINKVGGQVLYNLKIGGYEGNIYPINPKYDNVIGKKAYPSVSKVPEQIDLVISVIPNFRTVPIIEECVEMGVKFVLIITAGFQEIEKLDERAAKFTKQIKAAIKRARGVTRIVGPNCMGISSTLSKVNAMMGFLPLAKRLEKFNISITSQSGTWAWRVVNSANSHGIGISNVISNGNELDLKFEDFVEYYGFHDEGTDAIVGFLEGFRNGRKMKRIAAEISEKKPMIILKGGKTESGAKSANSHTGSIAGSYEIFQAFCKEYGIIEAEDSSDLIDLARAFRIMHPNNYPKSDQIGVFTGGGGAGVILSDIIESNQLQMAELQPKTIERLSEILPPYWPHSNPVDAVASQSIWIDLKKLLLILGQDENIDVLFTSMPIMGARKGRIPSALKMIAKRLYDVDEVTPQFLEDFDLDNAKRIIRIAKRIKKIIVLPTDFYQATLNHEYIMLTKLFENGILVVSDAHSGARIIKRMLEYKNFLEKRKKMKI